MLASPSHAHSLPNARPSGSGYWGTLPQSSVQWSAHYTGPTPPWLWLSSNPPSTNRDSDTVAVSRPLGQSPPSGHFLFRRRARVVLPTLPKLGWISGPNFLAAIPRGTPSAVMASAVCTIRPRSCSRSTGPNSCVFGSAEGDDRVRGGIYSPRFLARGFLGKPMLRGLKLYWPIMAAKYLTLIRIRWDGGRSWVTYLSPKIPLSPARTCPVHIISSELGHKAGTCPRPVEFPRPNEGLHRGFGSGTHGC